MSPRKRTVSKSVNVLWISLLLLQSVLSLFSAPPAYAASIPEEQLNQESGIALSSSAQPLTDLASVATPALENVAPQAPVEQEAASDQTDEVVMAAAVESTKARFVLSATTDLAPEQHEAQLGDLPLIIQRSSEAASKSLVVKYRAVDPTLAAQLSPTGIAFQLELNESSGSETLETAELAAQQPLTLTLDYSRLTFPFGGDFTRRLAVYRVSDCGIRVVTQADAPDTAEATQEDTSHEAYTCTDIDLLPFVNHVDNQQLEVDVTERPFVPGAEITLTEQLSSTLDGLSQAEIAATQQVSETGDSISQVGSQKVFLPVVSGPTSISTSALISTSTETYYVVASTAVGDYSPTPFSLVSDIKNDLFTGNFTTSYPFPVPPSMAGPVPGLSLTYNSGSTWGMGDNTNGQAGQAGIGWELAVGSISVPLIRHWEGSASNSYAWERGHVNSVHPYFIDLNGVRSKLINVGGNVYRPESDPTWKVELLTSSEAGHPDTNVRQYWLVTTPDGTKYRFGGEFLPTAERGTGERYDQDSVAFMPFRYHNTFPAARAFKWYLDRVEDVHGNIINYFYQHEYNFYELAGSGSARYRYVRATHLSYVEYTKRTGQVMQAHARIRLNMELRCTDATSMNCPTSTNLLDAPQDFVCSDDIGTACVHTIATFWSDLRLDSIQMQVYDQTVAQWRTSAYYDLDYTFPTPPTTGTPQKLWLKSIEQRAGGSYDRSAFSQLKADQIDDGSGAAGIARREAIGAYNDPGAGTFYTSNASGSWLLFKGVDFSAGSNQAIVRYGTVGMAGGSDNVQLQIRIDSQGGPIIGNVEDPNNGVTHKSALIPISNVSGVHDVYIFFMKNGSSFNWIRFLPTHPLPAGLPAAEYTPTMLQGPVSTADHLPVIGQVKTELGGTVNITYGQTHPCSANFTTVRPPLDCFRDPWAGQHRIWKVTSLTKSDPLNVSAGEIYTYTYSTPTWRYSKHDYQHAIDNTCWAWPNGQCHRRQWNDFRGHAIVTEINAQGYKTEYRFYQGMDLDLLAPTGGAYNAQITLSDGSTRVDSDWLAGKPAETRHFDASGNVLVRNVYWYTSTLTGGQAGWGTGSYRVALQAQEQTTYGPTPKTTRVEYDYDSYGNVLRQRQLGDVSTPADDRTLELNYVYNTAAYILNTPQWEKLWPGLTPGSAGQEQRYTAYAYDNQSIGVTPIKGNRTLVRQYIQSTPSALYADTISTYDAFGRVLSVTDANNRTTTTAYHVSFGYPMTVTNALNHTTVTQQDPGWGVVTKLTDANGKVTEVEYDAYGRLVKAWLPTEPRSGPASLEYQYAPEARPATIKTRQLTDAGSATYLESWEFADGFGRTIQSQSPSINAEQRVLTSRQYNNVGQVVHSSSTYEGSGVAGSGYLTPTWNALEGVTRFTYDALGRQTQSQLLNAGTVIQNSQIVYQGWQQQHYDANSHRRDYEYDAFNQLARVREYNVVAGNLLTSTTSYTYSLQGNLTQVSDPANNLTTISYDLLGRKTAIDDPDMGTWRYQYDNVGNLVAQQDGRGLWLHLDYDPLHRLTAKRRDSTTGPLLSQYIYDVTDLGQLYGTKAYAADGTNVTVETQVPERDDRYRATQNRWIVAGQGAFRMATSYDAADRVTQLQYPGGNDDSLGEIVQRTYNSVGQLNQVMSLMDGVHFIDATSYLANGQIASQRLDMGSNGLLREYSYEAGTRRLQTQKASSAILPGSHNLQALTYSYDDVGNITRILDDTNSGQQQCFGYDSLDQLTRAFTGNGDCSSYSATGTGAYDHSYGYDAIGNITNFAGESFAYTGVQPHAVTAAHGNTYSYDGNGNQITRAIGGIPYMLTYDQENRLIAVNALLEACALISKFVYDVDGQRVVGTVNGETVVYIAGVYEYHAGGATISYYEGSAGAVAMRRVGHAEDNGIFYIVGDHLGSASVIVHQDGTPSAYQYYYPYGGNRGELLSPLTTKRYTGQYHEEGLPGGEGLSYYGARWYDAQLGRFTSADSLVPTPSTPGTLNRYAYVLNNPLKYRDPSGHAVEKAIYDGGGAPPPDADARYLTVAEGTYAGFTLDLDHATAGIARGDTILSDLNTGSQLTNVQDQLRPVFGRALGRTSEYSIMGPVPASMHKSVGLGIYLDSQMSPNGWETWQGSGWFSPITEWYKGSSYSVEDLPSDYAGFFIAANYPNYIKSSPRIALTLFALQLGEAKWSKDAPVHAGYIGKAYSTGARQNVPIFWGDIQSKNYNYTPRVKSNNGWTNIPWPAHLSIGPSGRDVYWHRTRSYTTLTRIGS